MNKPKFNSLKEFIESKEVEHEKFDLKLQMNKEAWINWYKEQIKIIEQCDVENSDSIISFMNKRVNVPAKTFFYYDCDGSILINNQESIYTNGLIREIYRSLWGFKDLTKDGYVKKFSILDRKFINITKKNFGPDVMNSFYMSFSKYLVLKFPKIFKLNGFRTGFMVVNKNDSNLSFKEIMEKYNLELDEYVREFASLTHTIGNMVLVPAGYNAERGVGDQKDFWDLSLKSLRNDKKYDFNDEVFIKYVNTFFLWDYVDRDLSIKPLFKNHSIKKVFFSNEQEYKEYFENVNNSILNRGKFMYKMLVIENENHEAYTKIIKHINSESKIIDYKIAEEIIKKYYKN